MENSQFDNQVRRVSYGIAWAVVVAGTMMFLPVTILESLLGPVGEFSHALIAFMAGALVLGGATYFAVRQNNPVHAIQPAPHRADHNVVSNRFNAVKYLLAKIQRPEIVEDTRTFADLARFKGADKPTSRPLLMAEDLPALRINQPDDRSVQILEVDAEPVVPEPSISLTSAASGPEPEMTTADMVAQLEAAVAKRQELADVQSMTNPSSSDVAIVSSPLRDLVQEHDSMLTLDNEVGRPMLELVPSTALPDDNPDSALAAALATLHRMTANAR